MNLHAIAAPMLGVINEPILGRLYASIGYTTADDGTQVPNSKPPCDIVMDVQALSASEIQHMDSLNIQGIVKGVWANGELRGTDRTVGYGGDVITFSCATWLVVHVIEAWNGEWSHVVVQKQKDGITWP